MPNGNPQSHLITGLKVLASCLAVVVDLFPAVDYFAEWAPPFWPPARIITPVIGITVFAWVYYEGGKTPSPHRRTLLFLGACVVLFVLYGLLYNWTVARPPAAAGDVSPKQIGFGMSYWSLTEAARGQKNREDLPIVLDTPEKLMHHFRVWGGVNPPDRIWKSWSIMAAGLVLVTVFVGLFVCWSIGIGYLYHTLGHGSADIS